MPRRKGDIRLTALDWTNAALRAIGSGGVDAVSVEGLAKELGATKGSFYWHFADRAALITAALERWEQLGTLAIIERVSPVTDPAERLRLLFAASFGADESDIDATLVARIDDPLVGPIVSRVSTTRIAYIERAYRELGYSPVKAARQARIAYAMYVGHLQIRRTLPDDQVLRSVGPAYLRHLNSVLVPDAASTRTPLP